jgi:hypothetical protein
MGLRDKASERYRKWEAGQDAAVAAHREQLEETTTRRKEAAEQAAEQVAVRNEAQAAARERLRAEFSASCPLPLAPDPQDDLPSGTKLQPDEFLVVTGRDWGWSSRRLILTTHRVIQTHGRASKMANSIYLVDVRDVRYSKPLIGLATITLESASGGGGLEGLPAASNGSVLRDQLTALVHWARMRAQASPAIASSPSQTMPNDDLLATLKQLGELRDAGVLTLDEFDSKKRQLLDRL